MIADRLSLAALMAANAFEKARAKRRNIPYTPFAPTKSQLEDWKEVVLAVRANDHSQPEPASPWRDIESAPKDGTSIEVWDESQGAVNPAVVFWENGVWVYADNLLADAAPDGALPSHWRQRSEPPR